MAIWGAVAKAGAGMLKGGAKKVAADKLLGRGKGKGKGGVAYSASSGMAGKEKTSGQTSDPNMQLAIRPTTSLIPSSGGALATTGDSGGGAGGGDSAQAITVSISSKIIRVDKLLAGSLAIRKNAREDARKAREKAKNKKQEESLEKVKPPEAKKGPKLNLPGKGILAKIFGFFGTIILGWIAVRLVDWLPKITAFAQRLAPFVDGFIDFAGKILDGLTRFIDFSYMLYDKAAGWVKNQFGDEAHEKFTTFMGNLKELIKAFLVWKIIGERIFKSIISSIKNVWKTVTKAIRTIWVKLRRLIGRKARIFFKNFASKIAGAAQSGMQWAGNIAKKGISRVGGLLSKGGSKLASTGAGKVVAKVGGWAGKLFGKAASVIAPALKAAKPVASKFLKRIPIFGSLIVGIISLMSGEPLGQALFKTIGAAVGGALGTFIPIPILGTMLGEILGAFVGDLLYYTIIEKDPGKALELVKGALSNLFKGGQAVFDWVKNGFGNFITNFKEEHMIKLPKIMGIQVSLPGIGDTIPNLLQLYNPFVMAPLLVKSFFGGKKSGSKNEVKSGDNGGDDPSKGLEKQEKELISANQKNGYNGVMEKIESYAPYEDIAANSPIKVSVPVKSGSSPTAQAEASGLVTIGGGGDTWKDDAFESLDFFG